MKSSQQVVALLETGAACVGTSPGLAIVTAFETAQAASY